MSEEEARMAPGLLRLAPEEAENKTTEVSPW